MVRKSKSSYLEKLKLWHILWELNNIWDSILYREFHTWNSSMESYHPYLMPQKASINP
jgi:hypothetical protein